MYEHILNAKDGSGSAGRSLCLRSIHRRTLLMQQRRTRGRCQPEPFVYSFVHSFIHGERG
jgi:hypothetical protein